MDTEDKRSLKELAKTIIDAVAQRHAVFLRADEERGGWYVMDYAASVHKATLALKNAEIKKRTSTGGGSTGPPKKKKAKVSKGAAAAAAAAKYEGPTSNITGPPRQENLPPINFLDGEPPKLEHRRVFEVMEGSVSVDPYAKDIITLMCNQTNAKKASTVLDEPLASPFRSPEDETDKQRLLRLQLRQRYIAALTIGMSPVNFSVKLMEVWGGTVHERRIAIKGANTPKAAEGKKKEKAPEVAPPAVQGPSDAVPGLSNEVTNEPKVAPTDTPTQAGAAAEPKTEVSSGFSTEAPKVEAAPVATPKESEVVTDMGNASSAKTEASSGGTLPEKSPASTAGVAKNEDKSDEKVKIDATEQPAKAVKSDDKKEPDAPPGIEGGSVTATEKASVDVKKEEAENSVVRES